MAGRLTAVVRWVKRVAVVGVAIAGLGGSPTPLLAQDSTGLGPAPAVGADSRPSVARLPGRWAGRVTFEDRAPAPPPRPLRFEGPCEAATRSPGRTCAPDQRGARYRYAPPPPPAGRVLGLVVLAVLGLVLFIKGSGQ
jgi:hypothetical protein